MDISDDRNHENECCCLINDAITKIKSLETIKSNCKTLIKNKDTVYSFSKKSVEDTVNDCLDDTLNYIMEEHKKITGTISEINNNGDMNYMFTPSSKIILEENHTGNLLIVLAKNYKDFKKDGSDRMIVFYDKEYNCFYFQEKIAYFYLIGKEVNDFKIVDTKQITAMQNVVIQHLLNENEGLTNKVSSLTSRLEALEASVLSLQNN